MYDKRWTKVWVRGLKFIVHGSSFKIHRSSVTAGLSSAKASWRARTANSVYLESMIQEILISEVEIMWILIPSFANAENIRVATLEWLLIPTPTMDIFAISSLNLTSFPPNSFVISLTIWRVFAKSVLGTVKATSAQPFSVLEVWMIMSTTMFASAMGLNNLAATPGVSGTRMTSIFASFLL